MGVQAELSCSGEVLPANDAALMFVKAAAFNPPLSGTDIKVGMWVVMTTTDIAFIGLFHRFPPSHCLFTF